MAEYRDLPYSQFNFLVDLGTGDTDSYQAGFQEVSGLGIEVALAEYRNGNEQVNAPRKVPGLFKVPDVTFKRGVIGATDLYDWINKTRNPPKNEIDSESKRNITVHLLSEDRKTTAMTWKLTNAFPMKYTAPTLNSTGADVAIEELVVACEQIELE